MPGFQTELAIELIDLCNKAYAAKPDVTHCLSGGPCTVRGNRLLQAKTKGFFTRNLNSDTEGLTTISNAGDIVVAFRGSETGFLKPDGALRDWFMTDFRSNRTKYPLQPGSWPDQTWVHTGFWIAYNGIRDTVATQVRDLMHPETGVNARRIFVTGFSLGSPLAMLAAIDLALLGVPLELYMFASPRTGDTSLNKLMRERVACSYMVGYRGDPIIHLPPIGPNFPLTWHKILVLEIGPLNFWGLPVPQFGQQYRTSDEIVYIDGEGNRTDHLPFGKVTFRFADHSLKRYRDALVQLADFERPPTTVPDCRLEIASVLHMMRL
jgi:hypothetical protein